MKRLVVNADDLGADEARNRGIFEAIEAGAVTSVSVLANAPALRDAIDGIRSLGSEGLSFGIHCNLSEGTPLSGNLKLLTGTDGCFRGKKSAHSLFLAGDDPELRREIRQELSLQIAALRDQGIRIDHLDGHQHVHIMPAVLGTAISVAKTHGIPWIRIPGEREPLRGELLPGAIIEEAAFFNRYAEAAGPRVRSSGLLTADHFLGLYCKGRLSASLWMDCLESVPLGLTEFMVHPGHIPPVPFPGPFSSFSKPERESELKALKDERFRLALSEKGIILTPFPEALN